MPWHKASWAQFKNSSTSVTFPVPGLWPRALWSHSQQITKQKHFPPAAPSSLSTVHHHTCSLPAFPLVSLLTRPHLESWDSLLSLWLQLLVLCPSSHPCSEKSAGESLSSFPWPQPGGKTPLSFPWPLLRPPTRLSSFLFLHCFHMLPYPLNLTQLGRAELSSPVYESSQHSQDHIHNSTHQHIFFQACVFTVPQFHGQCQYSKGGPTFGCLCIKSDMQMLQAYLEKLMMKKRQWWRLPL